MAAGLRNCSGKMYGSLLIRTPGGEMTEFSLQRINNGLGSDPTNRLCLQGRGVSLFHCKFIVDEEGCEVVDLASSRGTIVNGAPVTVRRLTDGDQIRAGDIQLIYRAPPPGAPPMTVFPQSPPPEPAPPAPPPGGTPEPRRAPAAPPAQTSGDGFEVWGSEPSLLRSGQRVRNTQGIPRPTDSGGLPARPADSGGLPAPPRPSNPPTGGIPRPPSDSVVLTPRSGPMRPMMPPPRSLEDPPSARLRPPMPPTTPPPGASAASALVDEEDTDRLDPSHYEAIDESETPTEELKEHQSLKEAIDAQDATAYVIVFDTATPRRVHLHTSQPCTFGTASGCTVVLPFGRRIFPQHAELSMQGNVWRLRKLYPPAEVTVHREAVETFDLQGGEVIYLGDIRLEFRDMSRPTTSRSARKKPKRIRYELGQEVVRIGRDPSNQIVLAHPQVSRFHAQLQPRKGGWQIHDLNSGHGTYLNGRAITSAAIKKGDIVSISDFQLHFDGTSLEQESQEGQARIDALGLRRVVNRGRQIILHDVSLSIHPREFVAIVGASGAGKSTLMSALSGFRPADDGAVLVNGIDFYKNFAAFRATLGYVPQDDIIHRELTVYRALYYAARLRMPEDTRRGELDRRIEEVLEELQLQERRNVPISRLSGGQRKRVSIGVELLTKPRLFYLDEPTSGLDPGLEADMMQLFRRMADHGHTTILITHATKNLLLCNQVAFMARGGHLAWFGPPQDALEYFRAEDFVEIYVRLEEEGTGEEWERRFKASPYYQTHVEGRLADVQEVLKEARESGEHPSEMAGSRRRASLLRQLTILSQRYMEILARDSRNLLLLLAQAPVIGGLLCLAYPSDIFSLTEGDYGRAKSLLFFLSCISIWFGTSNAAREIAKEAAIFKRERTVSLGLFPYVFSKVFVLTMLGALQSAILVSLVAWGIDLPPYENLVRDLFVVLWMVNTAGLCLGLTVSALVSNPDKAASLVPILLIPQIVFSGAMMPLEGGGEWLSYLTLSRWGLELSGFLTQVDQVPIVVYPVIKLSPETMFNIVPLTHYKILATNIGVYLLACMLFLKLKDHARD